MFKESRKQSSRLSDRADVVFHDKSERVFVACGNSIIVYSVKTGMQVDLLRTHEKRTIEGHDGKTSKQLVHQAPIVMLALKQNEKQPTTLLSMCQRGELAEWSICASDEDMADNANMIELANTTNLFKNERGLKLRHAVFDPATQMIAAYEQTHK